MGISRSKERQIEQFNGQLVELSQEEIEDAHNLIKVMNCPDLLFYIKKQTHDICLKVIKRDGLAIKYVKDQTSELCIIAVKQNGLALEHVRNQTYDICLEAVKQNGKALSYVQNRTEEICLEAVKQNGTT